MSPDSHEHHHQLCRRRVGARLSLLCLSHAAMLQETCTLTSPRRAPPAAPAGGCPAAPTARPGMAPAAALCGHAAAARPGAPQHSAAGHGISCYDSTWLVPSPTAPARLDDDPATGPTQQCTAALHSLSPRLQAAASVPDPCSQQPAASAGQHMASATHDACSSLEAGPYLPSRHWHAACAPPA